MPVPTRTLPLPARIADSKSADIPMLSSKLPFTPHSPLKLESFRRISVSASFVSTSDLKSGFSSSELVEASKEPIVIKPTSLKRGQSWMMSFANSTRSVEAGSDFVKGRIPDFWSSPEVLTCMYMFKGVSRSAGRDLLSAVAFFALSTV